MSSNHLKNLEPSREESSTVSSVKTPSMKSQRSATYSAQIIPDTVESALFDGQDGSDSPRRLSASQTARSRQTNRRQSLTQPQKRTHVGMAATYTNSSLAIEHRKQQKYAKNQGTVQSNATDEDGIFGAAGGSKGWDSLMNLEQLRHLNMIDEEEYKIRRAELFDTLTGTVVNSRGKSMIKNLGKSRAGGKKPKKTLGEIEISDENPEWHTIRSERALCHEFNASTEEWTHTNRIVKVANQPFNHGALRYVYYMLDITADPDPLFRYATKSLVKPPPATHVAKVSIDPDEQDESYFLDVITQKHSQRFADKFNEHDVPKKVGFLDCWVYELIDRTPHVLCGVEEYIEGRYIKYTSNWDWINDRVERNTPHAFSHFSYECSGHKLLVCDLQGVGDLYTDPQMHSANGEGFGKGNMGRIGMSKFLQSHRCNAICKFLKLPLTNPSDGIDGTVPEQRLMTQGSISTMPHISTQSSMPESFASYQSGYVANPMTGFPAFLPPLMDDDASASLLSKPDTKKQSSGCCCVIL